MFGMPIAVTRRFRILATLALLLASAGCVAPKTAGIQVDPATAAREEQIQRDMRLQRQHQQNVRVQNVAYPILKGSVPLCKENVRPAVGMMATTIYDYSKEDSLAAARFGITEQPTIIALTANAPAEKAGVRKGDILQTINGKPVATGKKATPKTMELLAEELAINPTVTLGLLRAGQPQTVAVNAETWCEYPVVVAQEDTINAFADGKAIYITTGMLRFVETDEELATVIGHELAHNAMGHTSAKTVNYVLGSIFDVVAAAYGVNTQGAFGNAAAQAYSQEFEAEADYVGIYAMSLGGVDTSGAANFWRRMGAETGSIKSQYGGSHPGSTDRYVAIDRTVTEVNDKVINMQPLAPNLKTK